MNSEVHATRFHKNAELQTFDQDAMVGYKEHQVYSPYRCKNQEAEYIKTSRRPNFCINQLGQATMQLQTVREQTLAAQDVH
jgi:hypothetical protein